MPRRSGPWYRASRGMWFTTLGGRQVALGVVDEKDEQGAWRALERLLAQPKAVPRTVRDVVGLYLEDAAERVKPVTLKGYRWYLDAFVRRLGGRPASELSADIVERDARRTGWCDTTRANYLNIVEMCLRWARVGKVASVDLGRPLSKPPRASAGAESVLPEPVFRRMCQFATGDWYALLQWLWHTGCRPSEARSITVEMVDWDNRAVRLKDHKTRRHHQGDRIIYPSAVALEVLTWQRDKYTTGLAFRSDRGAAFSQHALMMRFHRLGKKLGHRVTSYMFRHSYATRALARGESDTVVAQLLGHAGTTMIHRHYSHLSERSRELKDAAERIGRAELTG